MKIYLSCLFFYVLFSQTLFAQNSNWENGIVVLQNGDSINGKVFYRNEADISLGFTFRDSTNTDRQFIAKDVSSLILSDYKIEYGQVSFKAQQDTFTVLASLITKGTASLYQSQVDPKKVGSGNAQVPFFIIKCPRGTFPLLHHRDAYPPEHNKFKGVLNYATGDCNDQQKIDRMRYNLNDILDVILYYNKCKNPDLVISKVRNKSDIPPIISHQVLAGGTVGSKVTGSQLNNGSGLNRPYNGGVGFNVGYSLQAMFPSVSKKIFTEFGLGLLYIKYQATSQNIRKNKEYDNYLAGRLKILEGFLFTGGTTVRPLIQIGPSLEFRTDVFTVSPLLNAGFGLNIKKYFVGTLVEFPFTSFTNRCFYSLNFKYTFAQSKKSKQKQ